MGRPRKNAANSNANPKLDALAVRIRDRLSGALERNVDRFLDHLDEVLDGPQVREVGMPVETHGLPQAAKKKLQLALGQGSTRKCGNCRQSGHRADRCPNPKADSDDDEPEAKGPPVNVVGSRPKLLAWEEQQRLIKLVQETGDRRAMDHLIRTNMGLVHRIAHKVAAWHSMDYEDIVQEGAMGLMKAIRQFDVSKGFRLSTYADWWIRHFIVRAHENNAEIRLPARYGIMLVKMAKAQFALEQKLQRPPTEEEVAAHCNLDIRDVRRLNRRGHAAVSLDQVMRTDGEAALHEVLADANAVHPDEQMEQLDIQFQIAQLLSSLNPRDAEIIRLRFLNEGEAMTLQEIGDKMVNLDGGEDISRERVRQLQRDALERLKLRARRMKMAA